MKQYLVIALLGLGVLACSQSEKAPVPTEQKQNSAQAQTATFWIRGNCGMCEERIETTLKKVDGVESADWDVDAKMVSVKFNPAKTTQEALEQTAAKAGHKTKKFPADKQAHDALPDCCKEGQSM